MRTWTNRRIRKAIAGGFEAQRRWSIAAVFVGLWLAGAFGGRAEEACASAAGERVWAERVVRGDELVLVDGRRLRLAAVEAPRPGLASAGERARREAVAVDRAARAALADLVEGRELAFTEVGTDRHGRRLGHLYDIETGQWIEEALVAAGHLRVLPMSETRVCARALLGAEAKARDGRSGVWATATFGVVPGTAAALAPRIGQRVIVEGDVLSVGRSGGHVWLNFGEDFRRDFAVVMEDKDLDRFRAAGFDPMAARGRKVRVRGVVQLRDGPRIAIEVPESIERVTW